MRALETSSRYSERRRQRRVTIVGRVRHELIEDARLVGMLQVVVKLAPQLGEVAIAHAIVAHEIDGEDDLLLRQVGDDHVGAVRPA